jgi:hypothetical protein
MRSRKYERGVVFPIFDGRPGHIRPDSYSIFRFFLIIQKQTDKMWKRDGSSQDLTRLFSSLVALV